MGILRLLRSKPKAMSLKRELDVPPAPPTKEELPEFPSPKDIPKLETPVSELEEFEQEAVKEQEKILEKRDDLTLEKPIFVTITSFRDVIDEIGLMNSTLKENEDMLVRVGEFKEDEDKEYSKWESQLKDVQKKLIFIDKTLFGKH